MKNREDKQNMQNKVVDLNRNISIIRHTDILYS